MVYDTTSLEMLAHRYVVDNLGIQGLAIIDNVEPAYLIATDVGGSLIHMLPSLEIVGKLQDLEQGYLCGLALTPNSDEILLVTRSGDLVLYEFPKIHPDAQLFGAIRHVVCAARAPGLVQAPAWQTVLEYALEQNCANPVPPAGSIFLTRASFHITCLPTDGFLSGSVDGKISFWPQTRNIDYRVPIEIGAPNRQGGRRLDFRFDGKILAVAGYWPDKIYLLETDSRQCNELIVKGAGGQSSGLLQFRPQTNELFVQSGNDVLILDSSKCDFYETGKIKLAEIGRLNLDASPQDMAFNLSGSMLAVTFEDGKIQLFDFITRPWNKVELPGSPNALACVAISSDGKVLATHYTGAVGRYGPSNANTISRLDLWDVASRRKTQSIEITSRSERGQAVAIHPDGIVVATGAEDGGISLWNGETGQLLTVLRGHSYGSILSLQFSSDGLRLLSGGVDATMRIWDWVLGRELLVFEQVYSVHCARFSPDGLSIANTDLYPTAAWVRRAVPWKNTMADSAHSQPAP